MMNYPTLYHQPLTFSLSNDGNKKAFNDAYASLISITVDEDLTAPSMFTLYLNNWHSPAEPFLWSENKLFLLGKKVAISLGYLGESESINLIEGEITSIEPEFTKRSSNVVVRGYDMRHRLLRGKKTHTFTNMKDSDIAKEIANNVNLNIKAKDTEVMFEYVLQQNQTDMAFLQARARRIGFELFIEGKTLQFRPRPINAKGGLTLKLGEDLLEFMPRLTTLSQVSEVTVRGWNVKEKKPINSSAKIGKELSKMNGSVTGPKAADSAFGKTATTIVNQPVSTQAEADQMALGAFNGMALHHITGDGVCYGRPDLKAGTIVNIDGVGKQFNGRYYITSVKHSWLKGETYQTYFTYQRNAT